MNKRLQKIIDNIDHSEPISVFYVDNLRFKLLSGHICICYFRWEL